MSPLLFALFFFTAWTLFLVFLVGFHRWKCVFTGKVPKGGFPSDVAPEDGWYRRALQAHRNCVENLAVFAAIVLGLHILEASSPVIATLAYVVAAARVMQSLVHLGLVQTRPVVMVRFAFFFTQYAAFAWMLFIGFSF